SLTFALVPRGELEQRVKRARVLVDCGVAVANLCEPYGHRPQGEVARIADLDLVPCQRSRDASIGRRPHRIRARDGPILRVLVVIQEYAVTLFLPPFSRRQGG